MFTFTMLFVIVQMIITWQFIYMIADMVNKMPTLYMRYWGWRLMEWRPFAFIIDLTISMIIGWFTGEGMTSGFANLMSGLIISFFAKFLLEWKFHYSQVFAEYENHQQYKKENGPFARMRNAFGKTKAPA